MSTVDDAVQAAVPADLNAPDRIMYGLTARQVAILAASAAALWVAFQALTPAVPPAAVGIAAIPLAAIATAVALGRRDGITMDRWLTAALVTARAPHLLVSASGPVHAPPGWAPSAADAAVLSPLRLPAQAIAESGVIEVDDGCVALTAVGTVNVDLRTAGEQHAMVDAAGRWLNALSGPVQIVVSTRRVDMHAYADLVEDRLNLLPHPALADAAAGYARFLRELGDDRDPLDRHITVAHHTAGDAVVARRQAEQSARALTGLGVSTRVLDGAQVTDTLVAACDPWHHVAPGRVTPATVITGQHGQESS
jgi:hypothetical protein